MFFKKETLTHVKELGSFNPQSQSGKAAALITGKDANFGMSPVIKTFYQGKNANPSMGDQYQDWVETPPKQTSAKVLRQHDSVAIKVYKVKDMDKPTIKGRTPLKVHMIELQSPQLIRALKPIVEKAGVFLEVHEIARFKAPFQPLYFCYDEVTALYNSSASDPVLYAHLRLLLSVLAELFDHFRAQLAHLRASGLVNYKLAWTYFARGSTVYTQTDGTESLVRVVDTSYKVGQVKVLLIQAEQLAFNGDCFNWQPVVLAIPKFEGNMPVTSLPAFPFSFHKTKDLVSSRLTERGRAVVEYQDAELRECEGVGLLVSDDGDQRHTVSGRVIIDFYGYQKYYKGLARTDIIDDPKKHQKSQQIQQSMIVANMGCFPQDPPMGQTQEKEEQKKPEVYVQRLSAEKQAANRAVTLDRPDELQYMSPMLSGYSLKSKQWLLFHVGDLRPVQWNEEAYDHLVYPEDQKDLVLSFVQNHSPSATVAAEAGLDDVILGKGRGLVILLSGPPGTGKTLMAEAVADQTRRPLFCIQAEDLGTSAAALGAQLKKCFNMALDWKAVVLLDEADVFMAIRQPSDVVRNELVSIFLRELEYFSGTIFLTTNLLKNIDQAFRSRVDIHLLFNPLPAQARELLWRKFLGRLPPAGSRAATERPSHIQASLMDDEFRELGRWDLNGREIKNVIKTVRTWCLCKGHKLDLARIEASIRVTAPTSKKLGLGETSSQGRLNGNEDWTGSGGWGEV